MKRIDERDVMFARMADGPSDFSVAAFCETCGVCARFFHRKPSILGRRLRWTVRRAGYR